MLLMVIGQLPAEATQSDWDICTQQRQVPVESIIAEKVGGYIEAQSRGVGTQRFINNQQWPQQLRGYDWSFNWTAWNICEMIRNAIIPDTSLFSYYNQQIIYLIMHRNEEMNCCISLLFDDMNINYNIIKHKKTLPNIA